MRKRIYIHIYVNTHIYKIKKIHFKIVRIKKGSQGEIRGPIKLITLNPSTEKIENAYDTHGIYIHIKCSRVHYCVTAANDTIYLYKILSSHPFPGFISPKSLRWTWHSLQTKNHDDKEMGTWVSTLFTTLHCFFRAKYEILLLMLFFSSRTAYRIPHPSHILRNGMNLRSLQSNCLMIQRRTIKKSQIKITLLADGDTFYRTG